MTQISTEDLEEYGSFLGALPVDGDSTFFRVWAPKRTSVSVLIDSLSHPLHAETDGFFSGRVPGVQPGTNYRYLLDDDISRPDPHSYFQPLGVHGPSQVIDHAAFDWTDSDWQGIARKNLVIYELHIGAFTKDGTFRAAIDRLPELKQLGVTAIEVMPVAQCSGKWNWGYDGVNIFAVRNTYGSPDDFKSLINACHSMGIAVILDVVYNHLGPEGNYLSDFGPYFSRKHKTPWGDAFNFDGRRKEYVRRYIVDNSLFWLREYHLDGLRLDAVHFMFDDSPTTILQEIRSEVRQLESSFDRKFHLIAEANVYDPDLVGDLVDDHDAYDAIWSDCLMHSFYSHRVSDVQLTHRTYSGANDIVEALEHAYLFSGPPVTRVSPTSRRHHHPKENNAFWESLVIGLQTHDSVGNHPQGKRLHHLSSIEFQMASAALVLMLPSIPLIFMGEEYATEATFPFFTDFEDPRLRKIVDKGRKNEYPNHVWDGAVLPSDPKAFQLAKCHRIEDQKQAVFAWYNQLLRLRKTGIENDWLHADHMSVGFDSRKMVFSLKYSLDHSQTISIHARLAAPQSEPIQFELTSESKAVADSLSRRATDHQEAVRSLALRANHAVIVTAN